MCVVVMVVGRCGKVPLGAGKEVARGGVEGCSQDITWHPGNAAPKYSRETTETIIMRL